MEKEKLIIEGKTKKVWECLENADQVIIESKNDITAFDDPKKTKQFASKAEYATNTTCRVFELLRAAGVPVAYIEQLSPTEFLTPKCAMIPLEVIARRYAVGSYIKRSPSLDRGDTTPYRFHSLEIEFFLKTTKGRLIIKDEVIIDGLDPERGEEDPLLVYASPGQWQLFHPKKPGWDPAANLQRSVSVNTVLGDDLANKRIKEIDEITRRAFLVLESAFAQSNCRLIDFKIEFGVTATGELLIADVVDNDSWRLRDCNWQELSKESFRQGEELSAVEKKYGLVSRLVDNFRLPRQCLVFWTGSNSDGFPTVPYAHSSVKVETIVCSGHKETKKALLLLEETLSQYPDGGVIVAKVGRSNGLGPILAARSAWPVISLPATLDKFPDDVWSSLRMPSLVYMGTSWPEDNAVGFALKILSQKNPALYSWLQLQLEALDS